MLDRGIFKSGALAFALSLLVSGCGNMFQGSSLLFQEEKIGSDSINATSANASLIINKYCINCHLQSHDKWSDLKTDSDWQKAGYILPGDPENSALILRVKHGPGGVRANMPADPLLYQEFSQVEYQSLYNWIKLMKPADVEVPIITLISPKIFAAGTVKSEVKIQTNEKAICRWDSQGNVDFAAMKNALISTDKMSHSFEVDGLINARSYVYYVRCQDEAQNASARDFVVSFSVGADVAGPEIVSVRPSASLAPSTSQTEISVTTNESATCRYSTTSGQAYASMTNSFQSSSDRLIHRANVSGLRNGFSYSYFVRCLDLSGNLSVEGLISFAVASDTSPPVISNLSPSGTLSNVSSATLSLSVNEDSSCRYSTVSGTLFSNMTGVFSSGLQKAVNVAGLVSGSSYSYFVRCQDLSGNTSEENRISFSVVSGSTPLTLSNLLPSSSLAFGTTQATLSLVTNRNAVCRYSTVQGTVFTSMTGQFSSMNLGTNHSSVVTGLQSSRSYMYYVLCRDDAGVTSAESLISFSILGDTIAPIISNGSPSGALAIGTSQATVSLSTNEVASCRFARSGGLAFDSMTAMNSTNRLAHSTLATGLQNGLSYSYFVRCRDDAGNLSNESTINFSVVGDTSAPIISNLSPQGSLNAGTTAVDLTLSTNEGATCRYSTTSGIAYNSMTLNFIADGTGLNHRVSLSNLTARSYNYYVRCQDRSNNVTNSDGVISFAIPNLQTARQLMTTYCVSCHAAWANYTDSDFQRHGLIVARDLVNSPLIRRLKFSGGIANMPAPVGGALYQSFSQSDFDAFASWVNNMTPVSSDMIPPVLSNRAPVGALAEGTTQAVVSLNTNEASTCRLSTVAGITYANMTVTMSADSPRTRHTYQATNLVNGSQYFYHVRCADASGNATMSDYTISFSVSSALDTIAPGVFSPQPSGSLSADTSQVTISVTTNESASCRYSLNPNTIFTAMSGTLIPSNGEVTHSTLVSNLMAGDYSYYVRCVDRSGNVNTSDAAVISFSIRQSSGNLLVSSQESIRLGDRHYIKSFLDAVYGPTAATTTTSLIGNALTKFGGPCDPMTESGLTCTGLDSADATAPVLTTTSTPREGQRMKACNLLNLGLSDSALTYAILQTTGQSSVDYLRNNPVPSRLDIQKAYDLFYPGRSPLRDTSIDKLLAVATAARDSTAFLDSWRYVLLTLCYLPDWQMP